MLFARLVLGCLAPLALLACASPPVEPAAALSAPLPATHASQEPEPLVDPAPAAAVNEQNPEALTVPRRDDLFALIAPRQLQKGKASWYGNRFHGRKTASGERFNMHAFTAAHKSLPFGTLIRVRVVETGREAVVRINDRGPFSPGRILDLSRGAADALGLLDSGVVDVVLLAPDTSP